MTFIIRGAGIKLFEAYRRNVNRSVLGYLQTFTDVNLELNCSKWLAGNLKVIESSLKSAKNIHKAT